MQTTGEMKVVAVHGNVYVVEVRDCKNIDDDGELLSQLPVAYYKIHAGGEDGALDQVTNGAGEFIGEEY